MRHSFQLVLLIFIIHAVSASADSLAKKTWPTIQWEGKTRHNVSLKEFKYDVLQTISAATLTSDEGPFVIPLDSLPQPTKKTWPTIPWEGKARHNVYLKVLDLDGATMTSDEGPFVIPLDSVPKSIQEIYPNEYAVAHARAKVFAELTQLKADGAQRVKGKVFQRLADGVVVSAERTKPFVFRPLDDAASNGRGSNKLFLPEKSKMPALTEVQGDVIVKGIPGEKNLADGDPVDVIAKAEGVFTFENQKATLRVWKVIP